MALQACTGKQAASNIVKDRYDTYLNEHDTPPLVLQVRNSSCNMWGCVGDQPCFLTFHL